MDSSGMWSLHHVSVIVAISARFSFSISDSSVIFGTTDLVLVFISIARISTHTYRGGQFTQGVQRIIYVL